MEEQLDQLSLESNEEVKTSLLTEKEWVDRLTKDVNTTSEALTRALANIETIQQNAEIAVTLVSKWQALWYSEPWIEQKEAHGKAIVSSASENFPVNGPGQPQPLRKNCVAKDKKKRVRQGSLRR